MRKVLTLIVFLSILIPSQVMAESWVLWHRGEFGETVTVEVRSDTKEKSRWSDEPQYSWVPKCLIVQDHPCFQKNYTPIPWHMAEAFPTYDLCIKRQKEDFRKKLKEAEEANLAKFAGNSAWKDFGIQSREFEFLSSRGDDCDTEWTNPKTQKVERSYRAYSSWDEWKCFPDTVDPRK